MCLINNQPPYPTSIPFYQLPSVPLSPLLPAPRPLKIFHMIGLMGLNPAGVDDPASSANVVSYSNQPDVSIRLLFRIRLHHPVQD